MDYLHKPATTCMVCFEVMFDDMTRRDVALTCVAAIGRA